MTAPPYRRDHTAHTDSDAVPPTNQPVGAAPQPAYGQPAHDEPPRGYADVPPGRAPPQGLSSGGEPQERRPTGVTILAVLAGLVAVLALIGAATALLGGAAVGAEAGVAGGLVMALGVFLLIYALFAAAVAWGLFRGARWAWYAALVLAGLGIVNGLLSLMGGDFLGAILAFVLNGAVIWYLLKPDVKAFFGVRGGERRRSPARTA